MVGVAPRGEVYARSLWHGVGGVLVRSGDGRRRLRAPAVGDQAGDARPARLLGGRGVGPGEDPAGTAARELAEELGVTGVPLTPLFTLAYDEGAGGLRSHLFAFEARYDGPVRHQPEEVADGWWMPVPELRARLADPSWPFVPDGRMLVERWFAGQEVRPRRRSSRVSRRRPARSARRTGGRPGRR